MNDIHTPSSDCPYCGASMRPVTMACTACNVEIRGRFRQSLFQFLSEAEQELLERYLLVDFNIKSLEKETGMGYAAIRSRLDRLIASYRTLKNNDDETKRIMERVAQGKLSATEAAERIRRIRHE